MSQWEIVVRVRPRQEGLGADVIRVKDETKIVLVESDEKCTEYDFNRVYDETTDQTTVFEENVLHLIEAAIKGTNVSIFAYGPTGTGKTFTMLGTTHQPGVIPRTLQYLLNRLREEDMANENSSSVLGMSYLEVYNEHVVDLLEGGNVIKIQTTKTGELNLIGLKKYAIEEFEEFKKIFINANEKRSVSTTKLNSESSRSHSVLTLYLNCKRVDANGRLINYMSKVNLIDLAGSEDNRRTGNQAGSSTFKESTKINLSLTVLKRVVKALTDDSQMVPYRDSKLTRILCDCLGGNAHSLMFLAVAPESASMRDTASSLSFSNSAKKVKNEPVQNVKAISPTGTPVAVTIKEEYTTSECGLN